MKKHIILLFIFIGHGILLNSQHGTIFTIGLEVNYDLFDKSCDSLRNALYLFFAERMDYIPENYGNEVVVSLAVKTDGTIEGVEFEKDSMSEFDSELYEFLTMFTFNKPILNYYVDRDKEGSGFNVRMGLFIKYNTETTYLGIGYKCYSYWIEESDLDKRINTDSNTIQNHSISVINSINEKVDNTQKKIRYTGYGNNVVIKKIKPTYSRKDTIVFNITNNYDKPIFCYITIEGGSVQQKYWEEISIIGQTHLLGTIQPVKVKSGETLLPKLLVKDFYDGSYLYQVIVNFGFSDTSMENRVYSYPFTVKYRDEPRQRGGRQFIKQ